MRSDFMSSRILRWLNRLRKGNTKQKEGLYTLSTVTAQSGVEFVPKQDYQALANRVEILERTFELSQNPIEKLDFPAEVLNTLPAVVKKTVEGIMFNYEHDFPDFCFLGMRKALIDSIRIRFQRDQKETLLYDAVGNAYGLPKWIELAKQERYINRKMADNLTARVKVFGDVASHDYMANLQKEEVPSIFVLLRIALSRMFYSEEPTT
jgi:hypothetical protein